MIFQTILIIYLSYSEKIRATLKGVCDLFGDFVFQNIIKPLINPLKGAASLTGVRGYEFLGLHTFL